MASRASACNMTPRQREAMTPGLAAAPELNRHHISTGGFHTTEGLVEVDENLVTRPVGIINTPRASRPLSPRTAEKADASATNCPICLEVILECDAHALPCSHLFHRSCAEEWFQRKSTCPVCRSRTDSTAPTNTVRVSQLAPRPPPPPDLELESLLQSLENDASRQLGHEGDGREDYLRLITNEISKARKGLSRRQFM